MNGWISVDDRLPPTELVEDGDYEASGKLLCLVNGDYLILDYQHGKEDGGWSVWYCYEYEDTVENVAEWQPLPPKQTTVK